MGKGVAHATGTAERTQPSCFSQLNRRSTAQPGRATPITSCPPAGYGRGDLDLSSGEVLEDESVELGIGQA
jgi:hypothetical protein